MSDIYINTSQTVNYGCKSLRKKQQRFKYTKIQRFRKTKKKNVIANELQKRINKERKQTREENQQGK